MSDDIKNTFRNISFLLKENDCLIKEIDMICNMLEQWGIKEYYNVFHSVSPFFSINNDKYIFYLDDENIFFKGQHIIEYNLGDIFVKTANILRKNYSIHLSSKKNISTHIVIPALKDIHEKYRDYIARYPKPSIDFFLEFYRDLTNMGFIEIIAILIIRDFLKWQSHPDILEKYEPTKATSISHGLLHCMDGITGQDFFLYNENFFDTTTPYISSFTTTIRPLGGIPTILYLNTSLDNLFTFDRYNMFSKGYNIKICDLCKRFFIQYKDYDTKYCSECKNISYDKKVTDPFSKLYRKKYKTMKMRADRADNSLEYEQSYTSPWISDVEIKIKEYRKSDDYSGFVKYIEKSMNKYKPKK